MKNSILFLTSEFPPQPGGIGNHALHLAEGLQKNEFEVKVISDQRSKMGNEELEFDKNLTVEVIRTQRRKPLVFSYINRIRTAFKKAKHSDVILVSGKFPLWLGAGLGVIYKKRKYVAIIHGSELLLQNKWLNKLTRRSLKQYDTIIAVSHYTASLVSDLKLTNLIVIPNGFELDLRADKVFNPSRRPKLITIGNVTARKGQQNVIRALPELLKKFPNLEYHIVGIPTEQKKLEQLIKELGVQHSVFFHGKVTEERKQDLLLESDVFVMLSENTSEGDVEGFGIAILEGNSVGLPGIGALGCGIEDAIKNKYSGKLIDNKDAKAFVAALEEITGNYEVYSQNAKLWAAQFQWNRVILLYIETINKSGIRNIS